LLLAAGGSAVLAWFGLERDRKASRRLITVAAVVGALAVIATLPVQAILSTGLGVGAITEPGVLDQVLGAGLGLSVLLAIIGAALLAMAAAFPINPSTRVVSLVGGLVAAGSFAASGHTRSTDPEWLETVADLGHVWGAAAWFGGVVVLALALRRRRADPDPVDAATLVSRFSSLAGVALLVVAAAGGALAWGEVRALRTLTSTTYGWLLVVKVAVVALVALAGAYNRFRLVPAVAAGHARGAGWTHLRRTVGFEAIGLVAVLGLTGILVGVTPAKTEAGIGSVSTITTKLGSGTVNLTIDPNRAGTNTIHIYLLDDVGRQVDTASEMQLQFSLPSRGIGPITRTPFKAGPGHWQYDGDVLSIPGQWRITILSRVSEFDEQRATADLTVNQ
jgi:copper transport protein